MIYLDKHRLKLPLHVLCNSFEDCFLSNLEDLNKSNIIHYVLFRYPGVSSSHPTYASRTPDLLRNQIIKCVSVSSKS